MFITLWRTLVLRPFRSPNVLHKEDPHAPGRIGRRKKEKSHERFKHVFRRRTGNPTLSRKLLDIYESGLGGRFRKLRFLGCRLSTASHHTAYDTYCNFGGIIWIFHMDESPDNLLQKEHLSRCPTAKRTRENENGGRFENRSKNYRDLEYVSYPSDSWHVMGSGRVHYICVHVIIYDCGNRN